MANSLLQYIDFYQEHKQEICLHAPSALNDERQQALGLLQTARLPERGDEGYPVVSVNDMFALDYGINVNRVDFPTNVAQTFRCGVPNVSTLIAVVVNDTFHPTTSLEHNLPQGVKVMSLAKGAKEMPDLVRKYYNRLAGKARMQPNAPHHDSTTLAEPNAATLLNTLLVEDGVLVHVPKGVRLEKPIQIINIFNAPAPLMATRRILVVVEDGASASILLCDHTSAQDTQFLSNQVTEAYVGNGASLDIYELEESSQQTSRLSQLYVLQGEGSAFTANGTTLLGGVTKNNYYVDHDGAHAETKLTAMAIASGDQIVDNATCVVHSHPEGHSDQMMKYILDDRSKGSFYGTIIVDEAARFTKAYQSNRNILASADARMYTRPQLEIYCDEVKCSHGATVGQLDQQALFYMQQRGIPQDEAKMMLMQAFMADVIDTVGIPSLRSRLHHLIERRLSGSRDLCAACSGESCE